MQKFLVILQYACIAFGLYLIYSVSMSLYTQQFTGELKDRLGMYFYIKELPDQTNETYKKVIALKDELESK